MYRYNIRVCISESRWTDIVITANSWSNALALGQGQSPINKAIYLGEAR
jgi:hypothetical protein